MKELCDHIKRLTCITLMLVLMTISFQVPKLYVTSEDTKEQNKTPNAVKRRADMRRGSSVESVLSKKLNSRLGGLRGPLLEKNRPDEPTAGMTLRNSQPIMTRGGF